MRTALSQPPQFVIPCPALLLLCTSIIERSAIALVSFPATEPIGRGLIPHPSISPKKDTRLLSLFFRKTSFENRDDCFRHRTDTAVSLRETCGGMSCHVLGCKPFHWMESSRTSGPISNSNSTTPLTSMRVSRFDSSLPSLLMILVYVAYS